MARNELHRRFAERMTVNPEIHRRVVSYHKSGQTPGLRWFKYKEGFSVQLVRMLLNMVNSRVVLDPFAGIGTASLVACGTGREGVGVEIMPIGVLVGSAISAAQHLDGQRFDRVCEKLLEHVGREGSVDPAHRFQHVPITENAFSENTEKAIGRANRFIAEQRDPNMATVLSVACMSILKAVSYTRNDGQFLRWDHRSGRNLRSRFDIGHIPTFEQALSDRLRQIRADLRPVRKLFGGSPPTLIEGTCLDRLRQLPTATFDTVITSPPPFANRYDYTRTYALELAYLGNDQADIGRLRQGLLSATVENRSKKTWLENQYRKDGLFGEALKIWEGEPALWEALNILRNRADELNNPHVVRLLENYFLEMAVVVGELGRLTRPGGAVFMINDNVQYHGEGIPVDLILSSFAERYGFHCRRIWTLARGKGHSSQQMGRFQRREIRKCVYYWEKTGG